MTQGFIPDERLAPLLIRGATLNVELAEAIIGSPRLNLSIAGATELTIEVADPEMELLYGQIVQPGTIVTYEDLRMVVSRLEAGPGPAGTGGFTVYGRSELVRNLKRRRGPLVMNNVSPSQFVAAECAALRGRSFVQPSATRPSVSRDVPEAGQQDEGSEQPSSWTTFQRLAIELGYLCFEQGGDVFFGQPSWLIANLGVVRAGWTRYGEDGRTLTHPVCEFSEDTPYEKRCTITLPHTRAQEVRTGKALDLGGMPHPFNGRYLISEVDTRLSGTTPLTVTAISPRDPVPRGEPTEGSDAGVGGAAGGLISGGSGTVNTFVAKALAQAGNRYVYGAEASLSNPDPSAFDCSELVEWAAAQAGVRFVDGSQNQRAAIRRAGRIISVQQAAATRGALLFTDGHVAISLGDGRTIEARNSRVGVVVGKVSDIRFAEGGLIPGMAY